MQSISDRKVGTPAVRLTLVPEYLDSSDVNDKLAYSGTAASGYPRLPVDMAQRDIPASMRGHSYMFSPSVRLNLSEMEKSAPVVRWTSSRAKRPVDAMIAIFKMKPPEMAMETGK